MPRLRHVHRSAQTPDDRERGAVLVMVAGSIVTILLVTMLVVSGSQAYPQRRNAQNAADAAANGGARALDQALFRSASASTVDSTVDDLTDDHGGKSYECYLIRNDGSRLQTDLGTDVECSNTAVISTWKSYLATHRPTDAQPVGVEVIVADEKPVLFGGLGGSDESLTARASAKASIQTVTEIGAPWVICANPVYKKERGGLDDPVDLLTTTADGPDADNLPDFVFNPDGTVDIDPLKAAAASSLNGGKGIGLDGSKVSECGTGADFDGKGLPGAKFSVPGYAPLKNGTGYDEIIQDQVLSTNPCPTPLPPTLNGCEILIPVAIRGESMKAYVVTAGVFSVTGNGNGQYGYYGKYVGKATYITGTHATSVPPSSSSLRVIRLIA